MRAIFVNSIEPVCGVHAFGRNLYSVLEPSEDVEWTYHELTSDAPLAAMTHDVIVYNYQPMIGGWMANAPFAGLGKQVLMYHDLHVDDARWDAILFADPGMIPHDNWHRIGRPLPAFQPRPLPHVDRMTTIGVHGFLGAWADRVVQAVSGEFEYATVRLLLPFARYGDPTGDQARAVAEKCRSMVQGTNVSLEVSHEFLTQAQLLDWLRQNDLNCYFRDPNWHWTGVASAPDAALAVRRPIAVNRCNAFRHLHGLSPSICIEGSSLSAIMANGLTPLVPLYNEWSPENVRRQVEDVLASIVNQA